VVLKTVRDELPLRTGIVAVAFRASVNDAVHAPSSLPGVTVNVVPDGGVNCATNGLLVGTGEGTGFAVHVIDAVNGPAKPSSLTVSVTGVGAGDAVTSKTIAEFGETTGVGTGVGVGVGTGVGLGDGLGVGVGVPEVL
jgi:hypothetical protein